MLDWRNLAVRSALDALHWSGARHLFGDRAGGIGMILMFHHVRPASSEPFRPNDHLEVTPDFLRLVVERLKARDIDIVDMDEAMRRVARPGSRRFAVLTFDDGYRNNLTLAYPVLKSLQVPFTVYVATGLVDRIALPWWDAVGEIVAQRERVDGSIGEARLALPAASPRQKWRATDALICALAEVGEDDQRIAVRNLARENRVDVDAMADREMMDWDDVRRLAADPLVTIGAHTVGHYALARLEAGRVRSEMLASADRLEEMIGVRPRHFAYPYGSPRTAASREFALAAEAGFATAVTTRRGVLKQADRERPTWLPRISMNGRYQSIRYLDLFLSGLPYVIEDGLRRAAGRPIRNEAGEASASTR